MDCYIEEITETHLGRATVLPGRIVLYIDTKLYEMVEKLSEYYVIPNRIWYKDLFVAIRYCFNYGFPNVTKSILSHVTTPFSLKYKAYDSFGNDHYLWEYTVSHNGTKSTYVTKSHLKRVEKRMLEYGIPKISTYNYRYIK